MIRKFLIAVLFAGAVAPAFADDECPKEYGFFDFGAIQTQNLFDKNSPTIIMGGYYNVAGDIVNADGYWYDTKYYNIDKLNPLYIFGTETFDNQLRAKMIEYDENKQRIDFRTVYNFKGFRPQHSETKYYRFSGKISWLDTLQIQNEEPITKIYIPYGYYELQNINDCTLCPPNTYKDFVGNDACIPCPNGTMSPAGATSADECGRVLHIGGKVYHLNSVKKTSPAIHVRDENGKIWYGNLYSEE